MFEGACCFKTPVSVSLNRLSSRSPPFRCLFHPSRFLSLVSSRRVTVMIRGRCGTRTPRGAPTTTGHPTQRAPRLGRLLLTPGAPHPRAIRRLTRAQVRKSFDCLIAAYDLVLCKNQKFILVIVFSRDSKPQRNSHQEMKTMLHVFTY